MELGESFDVAAVREMKEETGLEETAYRILSNFEYEIKYSKHYPKLGFDKEITMKTWLAEILDPDHKIVMSSEHQTFCWVSLEDSIELLKTRSGHLHFIDCFQKCEETVQMM